MRECMRYKTEHVNERARQIQHEQVVEFGTKLEQVDMHDDCK